MLAQRGARRWIALCDSAWSFCTVSHALLAFFIVALAYPTCHVLMTSWEHNPDYAHNWFLLPAIGWLVFKAKPWHYRSTSELTLGSLTMVAGGILHLGTLVVPLPLVDYAGWVLLLRGLALCIWGRSGARTLMPILAFGILLFPLPMLWLNNLAMILQDIIARIAEWMLSYFWVCLRRGPLLYLAGMETPVSVAVECSGVRQVVVFLAISWFLALHLQGPWWKKLLLTFASVPIAIAANVIRVLCLVVIARQWGTSSIDGMLHDAPLLITLPAGVALLWWTYQQLQQPLEVATVPQTTTVATDVCLPVVITCLLTLAQLGLLYHLHLSIHDHPTDRLHFHELPWKLGNWKGTTHPEAERIEKQATFADATLLRAYSNSTGQAAAVYLVYSASGRDRLHHPEICLRDAGGASEWKPGHRIISLDAHGKRQVERLCFERQRNQRTTVYYWHYTLIPPQSEQQSLLQRLHWKQQDRWPSVTVQVQTNTTDTVSWQRIEETLLPEIDRWLLQQLPGSVQTGSQRLPIRFTMLR